MPPDEKDAVLASAAELPDECGVMLASAAVSAILLPLDPSSVRRGGFKSNVSENVAFCARRFYFTTQYAHTHTQVVSLRSSLCCSR